MASELVSCPISDDLDNLLTGLINSSADHMHIMLQRDLPGLAEYFGRVADL
jgi:hypothetical protein